MENTNKQYKALIDLHNHLDGSLTLDIIKKLADIEEINLRGEEKDLLRKLTAPEDCKDLNDYLTKFAFSNHLLQSQIGIENAVYFLLEKLKEQGLIYTEIRFAPQLSIKNGLSQDEVVEAAIRGLKRSSLKAGLILCCLRGDKNEAFNIGTIEVAEKFLNKGVCAIDIAGAEALYKTSEFENLFKLAKEKGIPFTIHAGEADDYQSVDCAIDFGAKRIGHGVNSIHSLKTLERLKQENITLEICPTSNIQTQIFKSINDFPFKTFLEKGIKFTINTDNMAVSSTDINKELNLVANGFNLSEKDIGKLLLNSADCAFLDDESKKELKNIIINTYAL